MSVMCDRERNHTTVNIEGWRTHCFFFLRAPCPPITRKDGTFVVRSVFQGCAGWVPEALTPFADERNVGYASIQTQDALSSVPGAKSPSMGISL